MPQREKTTKSSSVRAVGLARLPGAKASQIARNLGIRVNQIYRWRRELENGGKKTFPGNDTARPGTTGAEDGTDAGQDGTGFFARCGGVLHPGIVLRYEAIRRHHGQYPVQ